jgi:hypothetical protein
MPLSCVDVFGIIDEPQYIAATQRHDHPAPETAVIADRQRGRNKVGLELVQNRYSFLVVDTEANPPDDDFVELVNGCRSR